MRYIYYNILFLCLFCLFSCKNKDIKQIEVEDTVPIEKDLQAEVLFTSEDLDITTPEEVCLVNDSLLVTKQFKHETFLDVWNINTKKHLNQFLKHGEGPSEVLYPFMQPCEQERCLYVNDLFGRSMYRIGYSELLKAKPRIEKILQWESSDSPKVLPGWTFYMGNDSYFSINEMDSARFIIRGPAGTTKLFGEYPDKNKVDAKLTPMANAMLYKNAAVTVSPDYKKIFLFHWFADMITSIDLKGKEPVVSNDIRAYPNDIFIVAGGENVVYAATTEQSYVYYTDACSTKEYIYVLWEGYRYNDELHAHGLAHSKTIRVFDWEGNLRYTLHLDKPVMNIYVTSDNKTLIATTQQNDYEVYRYQLDLD